MTDELNEARFNLHVTQGKLNYHLELFGDHLAKREGYKGLDGLDALYLFLIEKHHWTPAEVRGMKLEDISLVLHKEMLGWRPKSSFK